MPRSAADTDLADSLDAIRVQTVAGEIKWVRLLHPIDGSLMAYKGKGCLPPDFIMYVYMLDDDYLLDDSPDIEDGPSITRYLNDDDQHFDAMVLAKFSGLIVQESMAKLVRLVRKIAE